jgi:tetratricopeptide (TPR) repeat protein/predicted Ser/Thr protein kinase
VASHDIAGSYSLVPPNAVTEVTGPGALDAGERHPTPLTIWDNSRHDLEGREHMTGPASPVECPKCRHSNPTGSLHCAKCNAFLSSDDDLTEVIGDGWSMAAPAAAAGAAAALAPGRVIGERYEILQLLGEGGMGAVFKAMDRQLDRHVALKIIRPELAGSPNVLRRFKQELLLARQVTHRNVIRIFDLGVADGLHFITMDFVQGRDLNHLLEERKFAPEETVKIVRQVAEALDAAHAESVIHRDLKPHNIMVTDNGKVYVMDFGLARSVENSGLTRTGALLGTPTYMSPEQAKGAAIDTRSDLFALGVIFYEMLTGVIPFKADTVLASLLKRTQEPPPPPAEVNPAIPAVLSGIVMRCLAIDPANRYQTAAELLQDLRAVQGQSSESGAGSGSLLQPRVLAGASAAVAPKSSKKKWIVVSLGAAVLALAGVLLVPRMLHRPAKPVAPMTVIIADFNNHIGDPIFTGTLEPALRLALQGATFINAYDHTRMSELGVRAASGALNESKVQEIAANQGLNVVVAGALDRRGSEYRLSLHAVQAITGKVITNAEEIASNKDDVLFAVAKLGTTVRKALGDSTSESAQRFSMETLTAASLEAVHEYASGLDVLSQGQREEALKHFSQAVDLDANFGLAYAGMAVASHNLGRSQDAEKYIRQAIAKIDHMTERERFRTRAFLYLQSGDQQKCVDAYAALLGKYPSDTGALNNMAICSAHLRKMPLAVEGMQRVLAILPKRALYHVNLSVYSAYSGDFQTAAKEATVALQLNPSYGSGLQAQALASLGQDQVSQAAEAYHRLEKTRPNDAATGLADLAVYEGRYQEAVGILEKAAAADAAAGNKEDAADKYSALANAQLLRGQKGPALDAVKSALAISHAPKTRFIAGRVYVALGESEKAKEIADSLSKESQVEPQAFGLLVEGEAALKNGDGRGAVPLFMKANSLLDTWIGRFDLGRAYLELGSFPEADSEFDRCLKRHGEALALFVDIVPTYGYLPPAYYYQGRAREGMKAAGFAESYKKYLSIRGKSGEDPLLADARRRAQ